ncbi:cupin domain-containing protein [Bosea sp. (in: a-proteobacteria)]|jgi:uncharacterized cupin superfamily protein|uniref:cupin domain-containing protein n=1 Tax=Bosea sp. (in: a-proteobacteria) TaxID=1871050 RepID=UPI003F6EC81B
MTPATMLLARADDAPVTTRFTPGGLDEADPFAAGREIAWSGADGVVAGRVTWSGRQSAARATRTEMIVLHAGRLRLASQGSSLVLQPGQGAVIGSGTVFDAEADSGTRWAFCAAPAHDQAAAGLHALSADSALTPSAAPPTEMLIGEVPRCRSHNGFTDAAAGFRAGLWDSTPYHRIARPHPVHELMHLLAGSVDLTAADGEVVHVAAGDTAFVARGAAGAWLSREHVVKFYAVQSGD